MTVIHGIEVDDIPYTNNRTKEAIENNEPIEEFLHVIAVISNPCMYATRYILAKQFLKRMEKEKNIKVYVVELAFNDKKFYVTKKDNPRHLQLRTNTRALWHKENLINIGAKKLLPETWKAMAWIDADIEFESSTWGLDTLKILNGYKDIVQVFSHCIDMAKDQSTMQYFSSFGYQYEKERPYKSVGLDMWHPGYGLAITRKAYEKIGGLYDRSILGSGDHNMLYALMGWGLKSVNQNASQGYKDDIVEFERRIKGLRLGYTPGIIRHFFHGEKINRKYSLRWNILIDNQYDPFSHVEYNEDGLLIPSSSCPDKLLSDIFIYFKERNEDS